MFRSARNFENSARDRDCTVFEILEILSNKIGENELKSEFWQEQTEFNASLSLSTRTHDTDHSYFHVTTNRAKEGEKTTLWWGLTFRGLEQPLEIDQTPTKRV